MDRLVEKARGAKGVEVRAAVRRRGVVLVRKDILIVLFVS
jgi:hypothetical protein